MNGPNLIALAFILLGIGSILLGIVFSTFLLLHGPAPALDAAARTAPAMEMPGLPLVHAVLEGSPALFWTLWIAVFTTPALLFAGSGVMVWRLVGRPLRQRQLQETEREPQREEQLQALIRHCIERLLRSSMVRGGDPVGAPALVAPALDPVRSRRLAIFLRESGLQRTVPEAPAAERPAPFPWAGQRKTWARILIVVFLGMAVAAFLYGAVGALFFDELARMAPFPTLAHEGTVLLLFLWMLAGLALIGAAGVKILAAQDRGLLRRWIEARAAAGALALESYRELLDLISGAGWPSADDRRRRLVRALTLAALLGLDGSGKRRLLEAGAGSSGLLDPAVDLRGADLRGAELSGLDLAGIRIRDGDFCRAKLQGARLQGADLTGSDLRDVDLRDADLTGAKLHRANLYGARLHGAVLAGADLSSSNLEDATLWQADLSRANLTGARVDAGQLELARSLTGAMGPDGRPFQPGQPRTRGT